MKSFPRTCAILDVLLALCAISFAQAPPPQPAEVPSNTAATPTKTTYALEPINPLRVPYPLPARQQKIQGQVSGIIVVSETGNVETVDIFKGDKVLTEAAGQAAKQWKFKQVMKDGKAVAVIAKVTFNFVLGNDDQEPKGVVPEIAPATDFPQRARVSNTVMQGLMLNQAHPVYPPQARAAGIQGVVRLEEVISKEGIVTDVQLVSGPPELAAAAIDAVKRLVYRPYLLYGRPVEIGSSVQISFTLR